MQKVELARARTALVFWYNHALRKSFLAYKQHVAVAQRARRRAAVQVVHQTAGLRKGVSRELLRAYAAFRERQSEVVRERFE